MSAPTVLVTGSSGFVAPYVILELARAGYRVCALNRDGSPSVGAPTVRAELTDPEQVRSALNASRPDVIVHLAAQSSVRDSFRDPTGTLFNNVTASASLLYAAADSDPRPRVVLAGSAEEYGHAGAGDIALSESWPLTPTSPYGASKAAQTLLALGLFRSRGLPVCVLRPFNHTGPGQRPEFVVPALARRIAMIEAGLAEPVVPLSNPEASRDFTDVRDVARAYVLAAERAEPGEVYNVGSGRPYQLRWIVGELARIAGLDDLRIADERGAADARGSFGVRCDPGKLERATGWRATIPFERTLRDVLDYWRRRVAEDSAISRRDTTG